MNLKKTFLKEPVGNLVIGNKYVPLRKTRGCRLDISTAWNECGGKEQGFLYYMGYITDEHAFNDNQYVMSGDFFDPSDVIPYGEKTFLKL